jgi:hypothetical protein
MQNYVTQKTAHVSVIFLTSLHIRKSFSLKTAQLAGLERIFCAGIHNPEDRRGNYGGSKKKSPDVSRPLSCVGVTGFEPATSCSQSKRSSQTELHPGWCFFIKIGTFPDRGKGSANDRSA